MTWTDDHGEDGLHRKFDVYKPRDEVLGAGIDSTDYASYARDSRIGADGEFIFVLRPESDEEAYLALEYYAHRSDHRAPQLAADIRAELHRIRVANDQRTD